MRSLTYGACCFENLISTSCASPPNHAKRRLCELFEVKTGRVESAICQGDGIDPLHREHPQVLAPVVVSHQIMCRFLKIVRYSFEEETNALRRKAKVNGRGRLNALANSIQLACDEWAYAYLIRRALVLNDFNCKFDFEPYYPDGAKRADLVLHIPRRDQRPCQAVIEIKWVCGKNGWKDVAEDARKILGSSCDRKFLLAFPVFEWPATEDDPSDCAPLHKDIERQVTNSLPEGASVRMFCAEEFDTWRAEGDKIKFGLALYEVETASNHLVVGAGF